MANREFGGKIRSKRSHTLSKPYDKRKSFLNKFTDTVKDILVPSWLSDFMKGKSSAENLQNNLVEEQNGNEVDENEENDNYLTPQDSPAVGERRPAQPRPLHPEFSSYHQQQTKSISRRPNLPNFGNEHLPSHKVQYPPDPRFSTPTNPSLANDVLLPHTENSEAFPSPLLEKRTYLHLSEADVDQLRNRLHPNDTNATTSTHLQQQATDDNELDEEEASGSVSVEQEDTPDLDRSEAWNASYLRNKTNNRGSRGKRPSFEPSLFGSPFMKSSLLSDSLHESPFYAGKTRYGGAAANRKLRLKGSNPYSAALPYRKQVNAKPLKTSSSAVTSSTAKRILDTLEMMATPLSDAHRIPLPNNTFTDSVLQFTPSSLKRRNRPTVAASMFSVNSQKLPSRGPPTVMSNSPSIATIARNRQPLQRSFLSEKSKKLPEKTKPVESEMEEEDSDEPVEVPSEDIAPKTKTPEPIVRELTPKPVREPTPKPVREPTPEITPEPEPEPEPSKPVVAAPAAISETIVASPSTFGSSTGGKMKRDKSYSMRPGARGHDDEEEEETVQLETNFILPVKEMPKFAFGSNLTTMTPPPPASSLARPPLSSSTTFTPVTSAAPPTSELFTFSSPITNKAPAVSQSPASSLEFTFSSPAKVKEPGTPVQTFQFSTSASTMPKPKNSTPTSTSINVAPQLKSGSVLEALSGGKTNSPSVSSDNSFSSTGFLTAKTLKTSGSVMDILGGTNKSSQPTTTSSSASVFGGFQPAATLKTGSVMDILGKKTGEDENQTEKEDLEATTEEAEEKEETEEKEEEDEEDDDEEDGGGDEDDNDDADDNDDNDNEDNGNSITKSETDETGSKCDRCLNSCGPDQSLCLVCQTQNETNTDEKVPAATTASTTAPDPFMAKFTKPAGTWDCDTCMIQNKPEATKCVACETPKPAPAPPKSVSSLPSKPDELMAKFLKPTGAWECDTCLVQNKAESSKCCACETPKPGQAAPLSAAAAAVSQKVDPLMAKFLKPAGGWDCGVCMIQNKSSDRKCVACQTPNPDAPPEPAVDPLMAKFLKPAGSWDCGVCMIQNKSSDRKCVACQTPNPDAPPEPADAVGLGVAVAPSSSQSSSSSNMPIASQPLASGATGDADKPVSIWKCDTCLVSNPPQFQKCIACDTPRIKPAVMATIAAISSGSADVLPKFGAGVISSTNFKFGSQSDSSASTTTSTGGFKFVSPTTTSESTGGFKFGTTTTTAATTSASSTETTSNAFLFGQPAAPAPAADVKSSENSGFKFDPSSVSSASTNAAPFKFGAESSSKPSVVEEKTTKESGFTFSQPSSAGFAFGAAKDKTTESVSIPPVFGASAAPLTTGLSPFANNIEAPATEAASKPPAASGFSFSTATSTTSSTSMFTPPETAASGVNPLAPASPFGSQPKSSAPQASKPLFGFTGNTDTSKNAEVPAPFAFGASSEPNKSKPAFGTGSLKRDRNEECDGPSDAKRSFGSSSTPATAPGGFGGFNFAGSKPALNNTNSTFNNSFNTASSGQFTFAGVSNSAPTFGSSSVTTAAATTTAAAAPASSFGAPSFNFATAATPVTASKEMAVTTNTSQPFVFGSTPTPFAGGTATENAFGNKGSVFGAASSTSSSFDKPAASKPFAAPPPAAAPAPFAFGNNVSFNFSGGASAGGIYQFSGKPNETSAPPAAATPNIYQFGQTPSTNNAPLGANPSSAPPSGMFNPPNNFNFASGTGGGFTFGSSNSGEGTPGRRIKKAVRRTKN